MRLPMNQNNFGNLAESSTNLEMASSRPSRLNSSVFSNHNTVNDAMPFNMMVVITSCAPVRALSTPGMAPKSAPPTAAARSANGT